ncbi:lytic transglycosylase domain-containing protein [Geobacter sp. AOG2]|uniref:lytic transglycosylase domain-containing protein n=1 Tax=Geobacter sp. AOG2 TaxID=1566347 RepID=UPI001CC752C0|nr:transglycosylase SLT domain-containing protein [Geobacter sp. AOG2]GFE61187.1 lytic transglycosylase [Geobacter sp. AOG2]
MQRDRIISNKKVALAVLAGLWIAWGATGAVHADIYRYEDSEGIVHFTDAPTDKRFKIFMRDLKKDRQLRTRLKFAASVNPAEYDQIIKTCSDKYGVSQCLIKAVIHAESGYNPNAVSRKGASGLMQLMPGTARSLKVSNSFDPKDNVEGGVKYLRFLLDTFRGDVSLAVAAYNAGLNKVAKFGGIPPYAETRTYVNRVLSYMQSYQAN